MKTAGGSRGVTFLSNQLQQLQRSKWASLTLLALCQVAAMSLWFSASAVVPALAAEFDLSGFQQSLYTSAVQAGFVAGSLASAFLGLSDRLAPRRFFMAAALLASAANALILVIGPTAALVPLLRFITGAAMAGIYPVGMKLASTWAKGDMGLMVGLLVGALTMGSATPYLFSALGGLDWRFTLAASSCAAALAGFAILLVGVGPVFSAAPRFKASYVFYAWRVKALRLANLGYLGHMWELYAMWAWIGVFLQASFAQNFAGDTASLTAKLVTFATIAIGCLGFALWRAFRRPFGTHHPDHAGHGRQRQLRRWHRFRLRGQPLAGDRRLPALGFFGHCRFGAVLGLHRRACQPGVGRHHADLANGPWILSHFDHNPPDAQRRLAAGLALRLHALGDRAFLRSLGHGTVARPSGCAAPSWRPALICERKERMMQLQLSTWQEVESYLTQSRGVVIPIGSTEQHGPNGFVGTDALCPEVIARGLGEATGALVAPTLSIGMAQHHLGFPGSIALRPSTLMAVVQDVVNSLARQGFDSFFFLNGHGGNIASLQAAFSEIYAEASLGTAGSNRPALRCRLRNWWDGLRSKRFRKSSSAMRKAAMPPVPRSP